MNIRKRLLVIGLGLIFTIAFLETILRGIGAIQAYKSSSSVSAANREVGGEKSSYRILSLGNSYTQGAGAPIGHSFSDHLQKMLEKEGRSTKIDVINRGRGNVNSTFILEALAEQIAELQPNVIVLMTGECNAWNRYHYNRFLSRASQEFDEPWLSRTTDVLYDWLYGFRSFRLATMLARSHLTASTYSSGRYSVAFTGEEVDNFNVIGRKWVGALEAGNSFNVYHLTVPQRKEAIGTLEAIVAGGGATREIYETLARLYAFSEKDFEKAAPHYAKAIESKPDVFDFLVYRELTEEVPSARFNSPELEQERVRLVASASRAYPGDSMYADLKRWYDARGFPKHIDPKKQKRAAAEFLDFALKTRPTAVKTAEVLAGAYLDLGDQTNASRVFMESLAANPFSPERDLYAKLTEVGAVTKDAGLKKSIERFLSDIAAKYPSEGYRTEAMNDSQLANWIRSDIYEILQLSARNGVKVVLQTYAPLRGGGKRVADDVIREIALKEKLPFADNMSVFTQAFKDGIDPETLYSNEFGPTDSHLNSDGYKFMAEILKNTLEENKLLPQ